MFKKKSRVSIVLLTSSITCALRLCPLHCVLKDCFLRNQFSDFWTKISLLHYCLLVWCDCPSQCGVCCLCSLLMDISLVCHLPKVSRQQCAGQNWPAAYASKNKCYGNVAISFPYCQGSLLSLSGSCTTAAEAVRSAKQNTSLTDHYRKEYMGPYL